MRILLILTFLFSSSYALETPWSKNKDSRIQYVNYDQDQVVSINSAAGIGTQVVFKNEKILNIASGFSQGWDFISAGETLFIKAKDVEDLGDKSFMSPTSEWDTNLLITTDKRYYSFDLLLVEQPEKVDKSKKLLDIVQDNKITYRLVFLYPEDERNEKTQARIIENKEKQIAAQLSKRADGINWMYSMQIGKSKASQFITPIKAYDDGKFTYLQFSANQDFPTAFLVMGKNEESLINFHVESSKPNGAVDTLVLHRVSEKFVLRSGNGVVGIYNEAFDPVGFVNNSSVNAPGIKRVLKKPSGEK